ncbi:MAG: HigA family addiction module antitoxin [Treponema sp.]|nr:HigA family addiction module antitoxin [Treponema sp.]
MPKSIQSPGSVLNLFLRGYSLNPTSLSKQIKLSQATVRLIALDKTRISVSVAMRLAKFFKMKPEYWLNLQTQYDLYLADSNAKLKKLIKSIPTAKKPKALSHR